MTTSVVTGGAGFLGSHLCDRLLTMGHRVVVLDNLDTGSLQNIAHLRGPEFEFRHADCVRHIDVPGEVDFIFHLACPASPIDYLRLPILTLEVGAYGTHNALGLAKHKRARFVLASTSEVYGDPLQHPQSEDYRGNVDPVGPRGAYDESRRHAEAMTMAYYREEGLDTCIARIFNTYGPRMRTNDGRAVPTFIRQALENKPLTLFGDGSQTRSFCYVDDLIDGLVRLAMSDVHEPINLGSPAEITLSEIAELIVRLADSRSKVVRSAAAPDDPKVRRPNVDRARILLGWEPTVTLEEGLTRTIAFERGDGAGVPVGPARSPDAATPQR